MYKNQISAIALACAAMPSFSADLFSNGVLREIKAGDYIQASDTVGEYPIFQNDGNWKFTSSKVSTSTVSDSPKMGWVQLDYSIGGYLLARQFVNVSFSGGTNAYWSGSPCASGHLVIRDKGRGRQDNCMTIDAQGVTAGTNATTFVNVALTNAGSSGRYYKIILGINADLLGVRGTGTGDWTEDELKAKPYKKAVIDRLAAWAEQIQDGSIKAFDFSKPQDVYAKIPSFMSLLPVPEDLLGQKRSVSFVGAVEHLRHQTTLNSIAYSRYEDYKGAWGYVIEQPSQEFADTAAIAKCEGIRKTNRPDAPVCEVYRITDGKRAADTYDFKQVK